MLRARILDGGEPRDVRGRSLESIARTHFGRDAEVRCEHSDAVEPGVVRWTVLRPTLGGSAYTIIGRIVTHPDRSPGRPAKPTEGTSNVLVRRLPDDLKAELEQAARTAGRSLGEEIIRRLNATA
jgi:hypothetical protein